MRVITSQSNTGPLRLALPIMAPKTLQAFIFPKKNWLIFFNSSLVNFVVLPRKKQVHPFYGAVISAKSEFDASHHVNSVGLFKKANHNAHKKRRKNKKKKRRKNISQAAAPPLAPVWATNSKEARATTAMTSNAEVRQQPKTTETD